MKNGMSKFGWFFLGLTIGSMAAKLDQAAKQQGSMGRKILDGEAPMPPAVEKILKSLLEAQQSPRVVRST